MPITNKGNSLPATKRPSIPYTVSTEQRKLALAAVAMRGRKSFNRRIK